MHNLNSLRYNDVWSDWRPTDDSDAGQEETLELRPVEDTISVSGYIDDADSFTYSLKAETSAGRQWGTFGTHSDGSHIRLRSSPSTSRGLRLRQMYGDHYKNEYILKWLKLKNKS